MIGSEARILLFSIIIPVYNSEKYIRRCISSILNQSYTEWEIIIVDDGSRDKSGEICDSIARTNNKIFVYHKINGGVSSARNIGIKMAHGDRIMFLDSDDELDTKTLEILANIVTDYDYDVVCWALKTNSSFNPQYYPLNKEFTFAKCGDYNLIDDIRCRAFAGISRDGNKDYSMHFIVTKLIKRNLLLDNKIYFNEELKYHEDTLFCIDILEKAKSIAAINEYLYIRNEHEGSASVSYYPGIDQNNRKCIDTIEDFVNKYHLDDSVYSCAIDKFKLAWFMQNLQLNYLNSKNRTNTLKKVEEVNKILDSNKYSISGSLFRNDLKPKQRVFAFMINNKMAILLYLLPKLLLWLNKEKRND